MLFFLSNVIATVSMRLQKIFEPIFMILCTKFFLFVSLQVTLSQGFVRSAKENVTITTKLVSTKLTQNVDLMKLLNWKSSQNSISDTLSKIMSLSGEEIVKFLQDILDALFAMFSTGQFLSDYIFLLNFEPDFFFSQFLEGLCDQFLKILENSKPIKIQVTLEILV